MDHLSLAKSLFNATWDYLDLAERTPEQDREMVAAALASRHHWRQVGEPRNFAISDWQVARVFAVLGHGEPARTFARAGLDLCVEHDLGAFLTAYAYESLARAAAASGEDSAALAARARETAAAIQDAEERAAVLKDLDGL